MIIRTTGKHNEFWEGRVEPRSDGWYFVARYGRIGTKGSEKPKKFFDEWEAKNALDSKMDEKYRKGYRDVSEKEFEILTMAAKQLGTAHKIERIRWLRKHDNGLFTEIDVKQMVDPSVVMALAVHTTQRSKTVINRSFLFEEDETYEFSGFRGRGDTLEPKDSKLVKHDDAFLTKVRECVDIHLTVGTKNEG